MSAYRDHPGLDTTATMANSSSSAPATASTPHSLITPLDEMFDDDVPLPRFLQDRRATSWFARWIPAVVRRAGHAAVEWGKGPDPPRTFTIEPWWPALQHAPIRLLDRYAPVKRQRIFLWTAVCATWLCVFAAITYQSTIVTDIAGWGLPTNIGCLATYWVPGNACGLNGNNCRPFNGTGMAFRCPANCKHTRVLNPRAVGAQEVNYRPLVIGGPVARNHSGGRDKDPDGAYVYRSDSFICGAAIHAGVVDNHKGGCGVVRLVGQHRNYTSTEHGGIESIAFDSYFPSSFTFEGGTQCKAKDARWTLLAVSVAFSVLISLFTTSAKVFFFTIFVGLFFHTGLASDPPGHDSMSGLLSNILGKCLPATFCALVMYKFMGVRRTLTGVFAQVDKTLLWLGGCWIGCLNNHTFAWIPLERLDIHDLQQQPGAKAGLALVVTVLFCIVLQQAYCFQQEGRFYRYLKIYGILLGAVVVGILIPRLSLRIHHYILALLLLPGTAMQTRPALFYQGLLVGLFINGIARWGFDSVLQTRAELLQDGQRNSLLPNITEPAVQLGANLSTIVFSWTRPPPPFDGVSVLVNDVERYRGYTEDGFPSGERFIWTRGGGKTGMGGDTGYGNGWGRGVDEADHVESTLVDGNEGTLSSRIIATDSASQPHQDPEYFRFAYMRGRDTYDYTKAGTWDAHGRWTHMKKGPS